MNNAAINLAIAMFKYREEATGKRLPHDPDWAGVMRESFKPAVAGERGATSQQQCAYQAIRLTLWESGAVQRPWSKAFVRQKPTQVVPVPVLPPVIFRSWYRRWLRSAIAWLQGQLTRLHDSI